MVGRKESDVRIACILEGERRRDAIVRTKLDLTDETLARNASGEIAEAAVRPNLASSEDSGCWETSRMVQETNGGGRQ